MPVEKKISMRSSNNECSVCDSELDVEVAV